MWETPGTSWKTILLLKFFLTFNRSKFFSATRTIFSLGQNNFGNRIPLIVTFLKVSCCKILIPWKANWHCCWSFRIFIVKWNWPIKSYQGNIIFYCCWVIIFMFDDFAYFSCYDFSIASSVSAVRIGRYLVFSKHNFTENQVNIYRDKQFLKHLNIRFCSFKLFSNKLSCGTVNCQLGCSRTLLVFHRSKY